MSAVGEDKEEQGDRTTDEQQVASSLLSPPTTPAPSREDRQKERRVESTKNLGTMTDNNAGSDGRNNFNIQRFFYAKHRIRCWKDLP